MSLQRFRCRSCDVKVLAFEDETIDELSPNIPSCLPDSCGYHYWEVLPPNCSVVIATSQFMQDYQLDSWSTVYELDRLLNIEAREEKELKVFQEFISNT